MHCIYILETFGLDGVSKGMDMNIQGYVYVNNICHVYFGKVSYVSMVKI